MAEHCMYSKDCLVRVRGGGGGATQPILKNRGAKKLCRDSIVGPNPRVLAYARKLKVLKSKINLHRKWKDNRSWQENIEIYFTNLKLTYKQEGNSSFGKGISMFIFKDTSMTFKTHWEFKVALLESEEA